MHLCIDCRHFNAGWSAGDVPATLCTAPGNMRPDYVNGGVTYIVLSAQACRIGRELCTPTALWFEAKVKEVA
jgi:hypothetical protein